jgi:integrase
MAKAKKLPSGMWRCQVFTGYEWVDGKKKRIYQSFTAETQDMAEFYAARWKVSGKTRKLDITVGEAVERYITAKTGVLSPSTIRGYRQIQERYGLISDLRIQKITSEDLQMFVSSLTSKYRPKTVKSTYGLLTATINMFRPEAVFSVTLPKMEKNKKKSPKNSEVEKLFAEADGELKKCIALAAFGSLRRGEICGLKYGDIDGCKISVHADLVQNEHGRFEFKEIPKTSDSVRTITLPQKVIDLLGTGDADRFIINISPMAVTHAFRRLCEKNGINIRFHDLRAYYASVGAVLGVPDTYMSDFGGWRRGSSVLKEVYQGVMDDMADLYNKELVDHFDNLIDGQKKRVTEDDHSIQNPKNIQHKIIHFQTLKKAQKHV